MNRIFTYLMLFNMFVNSVYGFSGHVSYALQNSLIRPNRIGKCIGLHMQMESRRDIFMKPVKMLKLSSLLTLPLISNIVSVSAADKFDDTWTKHNGLFSEDDLKDFQKSSTGLLYKDVEIGRGDLPNDGDAVSIHMVGYIFETGEKWTNTYKGIPTFQSTVRAGARENQKFMKGLNEGVKTMKRGGKRILVIPAYLAYNYVTILADNNPNAPIIPGGSSLVCCVEVLDFKPLK